MSIIVFNSPATRSNWLHAVLDWLRQARVAIAPAAHRTSRTCPIANCATSAPKRTDIARAMDREIGRLGLLDIGWQQPRRKG